MKLKNNKPQKILMLVLSHYPGDPRVRREAEALANNGYQVDIICLKSEGEQPEEDYLGIRVYRILEGHTKGNIANYIFLTIRFFFKSIWLVNKLSRLNNYSVIQVHNMPDYLVFTTIFQKLHGIPVVLDLHDIMKELFKSKWNSGLKKVFLPLIGIIEKISWAYSDALITTSYGFKQCIIERGVNADKITLIFNTADPGIFNNPKTDWSFNRSNPRLLYHGTVDERFGIHTAIEAIKKLKASYPLIKFDIYGNYQNNYKERLLKFVEDNDLTNNVIFHNFIPLEKIREIISDSNFGIVPYISDNFMDLALSTKTFEYVAMKLPVIASDIPSLRTVFNENHVYYFKQNNPDHLADVLNEIFNDGIYIEYKVAGAANAYKNISWPLMVKQYLGLIKRITRKD